MIQPEWGIWFILIALIPLVLRIAAGEFHIKPVDWLVLAFLITAWSGYWAAYDQPVAWVKAWLVVTAVLMYFSLKAQPRQNLIWISLFLFFLGIGVSFYFLLTQDFVAAPRKLELVNRFGSWIMSIRPNIGWTPIHPNYVAGMIAVTTPFIFYPVWELRKRTGGVSTLTMVAIAISLGFAGLVLVMATSRGVVLAIFSGVGGWLIWQAIYLTGIKRQIKDEAVFPILLFIYLCAVVAFLYVGPAKSGSLFSGNYYYGSGSRAELFSRSLYLLFAFPITGGGLGSFPGLYSQYLLDIPFFNVPNSHNLFLDVGIEQGLIGGLSFFLLYMLSLWKVSGKIIRGDENRVFHWIVLFSLIVAIVHGMVDDYLYNGAGSVLSLLLVGLAMNGHNTDAPESRIDLRTVGVLSVLWVVIALLNFNQIQAVWHADIGAVQLAKVELDGFPGDGWAGPDIAPRLETAETSLLSSLEFDPNNRAANQRLGLIFMLRRDYVPAVRYLETARVQAPNHRGIIKSLAYCYVWLGEMERAQELLAQIPEAVEELDVYIWWWKEQGRDDLSENAKRALDTLRVFQP